MPTIHADTPEDLRLVLLDYFKIKHFDATKHAAVINTSIRTRIEWRIRAAVAQEIATLLRDMKIESKTSVITPPPPDHTGTST